MRISPMALIAVPAVVLLAACSGSASTSFSVSSADLASKVSEQITKNNNLPSAVPITCNGDLEGKVGATQTCSLTDPISGESRTVLVTVTTVDGTNVNFTISDAASASASPSSS